MLFDLFVVKCLVKCYIVTDHIDYVLEH
uniref:Uncharacterized protein n=1 Tax=Arundo donax TaxID=35708 RepID=A0A0A9EE14_ARUDO